jgi:hypothetical protein
MSDKYWLKPCAKLPLLERMMRTLAGPNAFISLEGDLSGWQLNAIPRIAREPQGALRRQTRQPTLDFAILPLRDDTSPAIFKEISRLGVSKQILHIQIETAGTLAFGACDNFHHECVFAFGVVPMPLFDALVAESLIEFYRPWGRSTS